MAITRAQIVRQLYKDGKRVGLKGGMDAGKDSDFGQENFGGNNKGDGGGDRNRIQQEKQKQFDKQQTGRFGDPDPNVDSPVDTIANLGNNYIANVRSKPATLAVPGFNLTKAVIQTKKARDMLGLPDYNEDNEDDITRGGGDGSQPILPQYMMPTPSITDQEPEQTELQQLIASMRSPGGIATRFLAEGGMADEFIGGASDGGLDAMGRQMYGLGKLVKKATRAVKKIVKSPVGKAALAYGLTFGIPGVKGDGFFSKGLSGLFSSGAGKKSFMDIIGGKAGLGILGASTLAGLTTPDEDEDQLTEEELRGPGLDLAAIRANPNMYLAPRFQAQEGGKAEPVAKKVMPLLDMDGMEKDYRETGGFVPIGRMEKADDVPARLSKNEFVFTADAVRNAGDGDIDKGAEVMYNMMKNLENGGDVSEESQGLEGARNMFQTSQRLEEVL